MTTSSELKPCVCSRTPKIERYALSTEHGYLSCDCGITFNGHHGDNAEAARILKGLTSHRATGRSELHNLSRPKAAAAIARRLP